MKCELGAICSRLSSGKSISAKLVSAEGKYPVYGGNGLCGYSNVSNFDGECAIIGRQWAFCGNVRYFKGAAYMTEHAIVVCADGKNDTRYLAYLLSHMQLGRLSAQSAQPGLSVKTLSKQIVDVPLLETQKRIAAILSSLDDKIENNKRINRHLEQMAQALFKSWFVDFTPFGGKMPKDWEEGRLGDICFYNSKRIDVSTLTLETYISTENMLPNRGGYVRATSLPSISQTTAFSVGDTLLSNIRPYFKKIVFCGFSGGCSPDVLCFHPKQEYFAHFVYSALYSDSFFEFVVSGSTGTKMPRSDKQQIMDYRIAIPSIKTLNIFTALVAPIANKRLLIDKESKVLSIFRDSLLPRLMSGEVSVVDEGR